MFTVGCGGNDDASPSVGGVDLPEQASQDAAQQWEREWCGLSLGESRDEIRAAMGEPTASYPDQDQWEGFGMSLTTFYDTSLNARTFQINSGDLPCEDRSTP